MYNFNFKSVVELTQTFNTEEKCRKYVAEQRWKGKPCCPYCGYDEKIYILKSNNRYKCKSCKKQFTETVGTIFHGTRISLMSWFYVIYLFGSHKKGISAMQISKDINVTYKTAWFLLHRVRQMMREREGKLSGEVEIDETFVGGKNKNRHWNKRVKGNQGRALIDKSAVYGFVERGGRVRTLHIKKLNGKGMQLLLTKFVTKDSSIYSDEYKNYNGLDNRFKEHNVVNHGRGQYVDGENHTNTIESFWSGLKKGIIAIYHSVSKHKLFRYCYEFEFRWNTRSKSQFECFENLLENSFSQRLTWKKLVERR
ncbi:MAG: IS1595 family transposase [Crocinitomicaceae bacterium]|nr:IS1595 family transposase [Crocinitomicaceae bacterium]